SQVRRSYNILGKIQSGRALKHPQDNSNCYNWAFLFFFFLPLYQGEPGLSTDGMFKGQKGESGTEGKVGPPGNPGTKGNPGPDGTNGY
uniref:Uncharacterized protein n=1 Tax=Fundulus heteroclitus TaxID=8078 RepID=A0A3Q2PUE9_FUNHE